VPAALRANATEELAIVTEPLVSSTVFDLSRIVRLNWAHSQQLIDIGDL
jgi:hypothetical protein